MAQPIVVSFKVKKACHIREEYVFFQIDFEVGININKERYFK